ncbi:hypothetical protein NSZ01_24940 [Nocardioides szechwanensis]|uniref:Uncharacterized protein n=1 Tax=Nocardioides szechwanensis TaxID=1005944 RepID=A0A1H0EAY6_9ACTN|nr:hypothetical protein [Nocardioides szechwanensis]GEP34726.1 hypothetical protein NSZ01_24940 [Nocardioides szechwanensis]SDN79501.1 hypothetical protein SAMN05192576_2807 [Nocardioides szechwanensis]
MSGGESEDRFGWFAYPRAGSDDRYVDPPVRDVHLRVDEYGGPFWYSEGCLGDDFDELHEDIGISRGLYDEVMAWHSASLAAGARSEALFVVEQGLLRRLAAEVGPAVAVPPARSTPTAAVSLLDDDVNSLPVEAALKAKVTVWKAQVSTYAHATGDNDAEVWAWQDAGDMLAREVAAALGDDYKVRAF